MGAIPYCAVFHTEFRNELATRPKGRPEIRVFVVNAD